MKKRIVQMRLVLHLVVTLFGNVYGIRNCHAPVLYSNRYIIVWMNIPMVLFVNPGDAYRDGHRAARGKIVRIPTACREKARFLFCIKVKVVP